MGYLLTVSLVWAFSFGLIKDGTANLDATFVAFARLLIALGFFIPWLRKAPLRTASGLVVAGAVQFGLMYIFYIEAFQSLKAHQIALLTIFTPLWVTAINDCMTRRFHLKFWISVLIATLGVAVIAYRELGPTGMYGIVLVQLSNACFAMGQLAYKRLMSADRTAGSPTINDATATCYMYIGGAAVTFVVSLLFTPWAQTMNTLTFRHCMILFYLGAIASGLCFFLWNIGTRKVNVGTLAIMNNLKIPLAVAMSLLVFGETANIPRLIIGGVIIIGAIVINEKLPDNTVARIASFFGNRRRHR